MNKLFVWKICFIITVLVNGCFIFQTGSTRINITGIVQVVGNHPFEKLALFSEDGSVITLCAPKDLFDTLTAIQGKKITVKCLFVKKIDGVDEADVVEYILLPQPQ